MDILFNASTLPSSAAEKHANLSNGCQLNRFNDVRRCKVINLDKDSSYSEVRCILESGDQLTDEEV